MWNYIKENVATTWLGFKCFIVGFFKCLWKFICCFCKLVPYLIGFGLIALVIVGIIYGIIQESNTPRSEKAKISFTDKIEKIEYEDHRYLVIMGTKTTISAMCHDENCPCKNQSNIIEKKGDKE